MKVISDTIPIIDDLSTSPLFAASLANKELFHSNFIKWFLEISNKEQVMVFAREIAGIDNFELIEVLRERHNFDLTIKGICNCQKYDIVIENKVKCLIDCVQLKKYSDRILKSTEKNGIKCTPIVLTLIDPVYHGIEDDIEYDGVAWKIVNYKKLANVIDKIMINGNYGIYHQLLLEDYLRCIQKLYFVFCSVMDAWKSNYDEVNFLTYDKRRYLENSYGEFYRIGMHDVYDKLRFAYLAKQVHTKYKDENIKVVNADSTVAKYNEVILSTGMTHATGICDIKIRKGKFNNQPLFLGIQIQAHKFCLVLEGSGSDLSELAHTLHDNCHWFFRFGDDTITRECEGTKAKNGEFCSYGETFIYNYKKCHKWSINEIIQQILLYTKIALQLRISYDIY